MSSLRLVLAQLNATVGDVPGNARRIEQAIRQAQSWLADVVVVPELSVCGYPPEDLLLKPRFVDDNLKALHSLARVALSCARRWCGSWWGLGWPTRCGG